MTVKILPNGHLYVGSVRGYIFDKFDDSEPFASMRNLHMDIRDICFPLNNNSIVYVATDGGISRNEVGSVRKFHQINGNLALNECYDVDITESDRNYFIIGAHDNGTIRTNSSIPWTIVHSGDGGLCLVDPTNPDRFNYMVNTKLWLQNADGSQIESNLDDMRWYNSPIAHAPSSPNVIYGPDNEGDKPQILKSFNYGVNFNGVSYVPAIGKVTAITVSPANSNLLYVATWPEWEGGTGGGLFRSTNGSGSWTKVENGLNRIGTIPVTQIIFDQSNENRLWASFGGYNDDRGVYELIKYYGNDVWFDRTYNLPEFPVNTIAYDHERNCLYAGTDVGVYKLIDGSGTWSRMHDYKDLPFVVITRLKINFSSDELIASTYGAGVWSYPLESSKSAKTEEIDYYKENIKKKELIEMYFESKLIVTPNPISSEAIIAVEGEMDPVAKVIIYDMAGKKQLELPFIEQKTVLNACDLKNGSYIVAISGNNIQYMNEKIVILK